MLRCVCYFDIYIRLHNWDTHLDRVYSLVVCFCNTLIVKNIFAVLVSNPLAQPLEFMPLALVS